MPGDCLVKVVTREFDDTEAEILYRKVELEQRPSHSFLEAPDSAQAGRTRALEGVVLRLEPKVDHRFDGIPRKSSIIISPTRVNFTQMTQSLTITKEMNTSRKKEDILCV